MDRIEYDKLRKLGLLERTGVNHADIDSVSKRLVDLAVGGLFGRDSKVPMLPTFLVVKVTVGKETFVISGTLMGVTTWLVDRMGEGQAVKYELVGLGTDRNWARSQGTEV